MPNAITSLYVQCWDILGKGGHFCFKGCLVMVRVEVKIRVMVRVRGLIVTVRVWVKKILCL